MIIESSKNLGELRKTDCTQALARDSRGNPVALLIDDGSGVFVFRRGDEEFESVLQELGITDTIFHVVNLGKDAFPPPPGVPLIKKG